MPTGSAPSVKRNCMVWGGISREPSFERSAHPPQQSTHRIEYQNQRDFKASRKAIQRNLLSIEERRVPKPRREMRSFGRRNNQIQIDRESFLRRRDDDIAKGDMAFFTALQIDGPRQRFVAIQRPAGNTRNFLVIDYGLPILNYGHLSPEQRNIEALPFVCFARQFRRGRQEAVYRAGMMAWRLRL